MTVLAIIGVIVLLLFLLLMTSVKVRIISDGEITLKVGAGPVMIKLLPKKNKRKKIKKFTQKRYLALVEEHRAVIRAKDDAKEAKKASKKGVFGTKSSFTKEQFCKSEIIRCNTTV